MHVVKSGDGGAILPEAREKGADDGGVGIVTLERAQFALRGVSHAGARVGQRQHEMRVRVRLARAGELAGLLSREHDEPRGRRGRGPSRSRAGASGAPRGVAPLSLGAVSALTCHV